MKKLILLILAFFFLVILSCSSEEETPEITSPTGENGGLDDFPNEIGSTWKYAIIDTLLYTYTGDFQIYYDTADVTIIDSTTLSNGKNTTVWQYKSKNKIDTLYVFLSDDSLLFYYNKKYPGIRFGFILPLKTAIEYQLSSSDYYVSLIDSLMLPAGLFAEVYNVKENSRNGNSTGFNNYFIVNKIGIIKYYLHSNVTFDEIKHFTEWELLSYTIIE